MATDSPEQSSQVVNKSQASEPSRVYMRPISVYTGPVSKRLVDIDNEALDAARLQLGTRTIKDTVNEALRRAGGAREEMIANALDALVEAPLADRSEAWR
jgi:Arc/MetJ family transcription regulator